MSDSRQRYRTDWEQSVVLIPTIIDKLTDDSGNDSSGQELARIKGYARRDKPARVQEWLAGMIGQFLCVPVAPVVIGIVEKDKRDLRSVSLNVDPNPQRWERAGDGDLIRFAHEQASVTTGILLFDVLISNPDRNAKNVAFVRYDDMGIVLFDHNHAFQIDTPIYSEAHQGEFAIAYVAASGTSIRHCLLDHLETDAHLSTWTERIKSLPDWMLEEWRRDCITLGLHPHTAAEVIERLKRRRDDIERIVAENRRDFRGLTAGN